MSLSNPKGMRITIMGLGIRGGGLASAEFFASRGAEVTVTDLKREAELQGSLSRLERLPIRFVLGVHRDEDFLESDMVIKNPAVPPDSPFLELSRRTGIPIETDISVFLRLFSGPIICVTGSKGKSTVASAIHHGLQAVDQESRLGGNITISPLSFLDELNVGTPVVLELSSWQLADLRDLDVLRPRVSVITNILPDHLNYYDSMSAYIADKKVIFQGQGRGSFAVFNLDDPIQRHFPEETEATTYYFSRSPLAKGESGGYLKGREGWIGEKGGEEQVLSDRLLVIGEHNRLNLLASAVALHVFGVPADRIMNAMESFKGIEHRLEQFAERGGVRYINDSAATIPHATVEALKAVTKPIYLITGGADKNLDFAPLAEDIDLAEEVILLAGSGTRKLARLLEERGRPYVGPFRTLEEAVYYAVERAEPGSTVLLSPGCTSYEMFPNEFERGRRFKEIVKSELKDQAPRESKQRRKG